MKKIIVLIRPFIIYLAIIMGFFFAQSQFLDQFMDLFNPPDTSPINIFNNIFAGVLGLIMIYVSFRYARDINQRHGKLAAFSLNVLLIIAFAIFMISKCALCWK